MSTAMSAAPSAPSAAPSSAPTSSAPAASSTPSKPSTPSSGTSSATSTQSAPASGVSTPNNPTGGTKATASTPAAETKAATDDAATKAAAEAIRKHKLKVNGREVELDEPEVLRRAQLAEAAQQKFQEASEMRKQAADLLEALRKNPVQVLEKLGVNTREFSEKFLAGELQKEMLTPEQRELMELRQYREAQEAAAQQAEAQRAKQVRQAEFQKLQQKAAADYDAKMTEALTAANMPKNAETVKRVAARMLDAMQKGYELDATTAVDLVRQDLVAEVQALAGGLKGEALLKFLGDGIAKEIRQHDLARIKAKLNPPAPEGVVIPEAAKPAATQRSDKGRFLSPDEWREEMRRKAGVTD